MNQKEKDKKKRIKSEIFKKKNGLEMEKKIEKFYKKGLKKE